MIFHRRQIRLDLRRSLTAGGERAYAVVILGLLCFAGCHRRPSNRVITAIPRQASEYTWVAQHVGVNEAAARHHVSIYWNGPTEERDVEQQVFLADRAIKNGDLGLILSPNNPFALNTTVQRALAAGMSVVIVGDPLSLKPERHLSFVLNDEERAGALAARRLKSSLHGHGDVLVVGIDPLSPGSSDRSNAFEAALGREAPGIHVAERLKGSLNFGEAELATEKALLANPHLSAILALNLPATRGAIAAVKTTHSSDHIIIIGCDYNFDLLFLLRQKVLDALIIQDMHRMGSLAVDEIMAETKGAEVPLYTVVDPVLITRENIDDEAIQRMTYMDWRVRP